MQIDYLAEGAVTSKQIQDLYNNGEVTVRIPEGVDVDEFALACINLIQDIWGEPEVNFAYDDKTFDYVVNNDNLVIFVD